MTAERIETGPLDPPRAGETPRPAPPSHGPGRVFRAVAGVREDVLDWAPEERPRYSRLGAIIVNTGLLAGVSLFAALQHVVDMHWSALVPIAAFWAFLVVSLDSWLIASTHGMLNVSRFLAFVPRLMVSALLGVVIAEPVVLWLFQPDIRNNIQITRHEDQVRYESQLRHCNPPSGATVDDPRCDGLGLSIPGSPATKRTELADLETQRTSLQERISAIRDEHDRLEELARAECSGQTGRGLTGRVGQGPNCLRNRQKADRYLVESQLSQREAELSDLTDKITTTTGAIERTSSEFGRQVNLAIAANVAERGASRSGLIGLLDQVAALGRLSHQSWFVLAAQWLLRLLLIALDCLPVLVKLMGGHTKYDRFINNQLEMAQRMHAENMAFQERAFRQATRGDIERLDHEDRAERARRQADERSEIDRLVRQLRSDRARHRAGAAPAQHYAESGDGRERPRNGTRLRPTRAADAHDVE